MSDPGFNNFATLLSDLFRAGDARCDEKTEEAANVRLIQEIVLAIGRGDLEAVGAMLTADVQFEIQGPAFFPFTRSATGREAVLEAIRRNFAALQEQQPAIESVAAQGDTVIVVSTERGRIRDTGAEYAVSGMHRFVLRDGKVALLQEKFVDL